MASDQNEYCGNCPFYAKCIEAKKSGTFNNCPLVVDTQAVTK